MNPIKQPITPLPLAKPWSSTTPTARRFGKEVKTYAITWLKQGTQNANVKILLYKGTATLVKTIIATTPNDGSYDWLVPTTLAVGSTYFIKVKTVDNLIYDDSDKFSIIVPTITVTAPAKGAVWVKNATKAITWTKLGSQDANVKIQLYKGLTKALDITLSTANSGSYDWLIPPTLANAATYSVRITTLDGKVVGKGAAFSIMAGLIQVTQPVTGNKLIRGTVQRDHLDSRGRGECQRQDPIVQGAHQGPRYNSRHAHGRRHVHLEHPGYPGIGDDLFHQDHGAGQPGHGQDGQLRHRARDHHRHPARGRDHLAARPGAHHHLEQ